MRVLILLAALWSAQFCRDPESPSAHGMVPGHYQPSMIRVIDRFLLRRAVFAGYITRPPGLEFHHPDYRRPFYGCWLTPYNHWKVHKGWMKCPKPHDYTEEILRRVL